MALTGHSSSHIRHPLHISKLVSNLFLSFTGMHESGQKITHLMHCMHLSKSTTGLKTFQSPVLLFTAVPDSRTHPSSISLEFFNFIICPLYSFYIRIYHFFFILKYPFYSFLECVHSYNMIFG